MATNGNSPPSSKNLLLKEWREQKRARAASGPFLFDESLGINALPKTEEGAAPASGSSRPSTSFASTSFARVSTHFKDHDDEALSFSPRDSSGNFVSKHAFLQMYRQQRALMREEAEAREALLRLEGSGYNHLLQSTLRVSFCWAQIATTPTSSIPPHLLKKLETLHSLGDLDRLMAGDKDNKAGEEEVSEVDWSKYDPLAHTLYEMVERGEKNTLAGLGGVEKLAKKLSSDCKKGVKDIDKQVQSFGVNKLPEAEEVTFWGLVLEALGDQMMQILMGAAVVSLILGLTVPDPHTGRVEYATGWIEGAAILTSVAVVTLVTAGNDYSKAKQFAQLSMETAKKEVVAIRDGEEVQIDVADLVVGDLLIVEGGDIIAADGVFLWGDDIKIDQSAANGESDDVVKDAKNDPFFLSGTYMLEGRGCIMVTGVGECSFNGQMLLKARAPQGDTPLQEQLSDMADDIGKMGLAAAILTFVVLAHKEVYAIATGVHPFYIKPFLDFIIVAVTIVVVAIPEGLPLAVTIALAYSMQEMMKDNCLVRVLASCETMGGATAICSDKTGTLTTNKMTVIRGWIADNEFTITGSIKDRPIRTQLKNLPETIIEQMAEAISVNSNADRKEKDGDMVWIGNKTEHGLLGWVLSVGYDFKAMRAKFDAQNTKQFSFNSDKKRMTTMARKPDGSLVMYVKGACEVILAQCTSYMTPSGSEIPMSAAKREQLEATLISMAMAGNRVILIAQHKLPPADAFPHEEPTETPLTCVGLMGIQDPIRPEVPQAVATCQKAGIKVRMVTGDNKITAMSIAKQCGIYQEGSGIAMEGREFSRLAKEDPEQFKKMLPNLQVLARSSPADKHVLVGALKDMNEIVAVTGDGTNDAPALKLANVGFAMKSGTDIAKDACDIVLLDDNFVSVVRAAMWGRNINDNIRKFIQFQVTVNIVGVALTFLGAAFDSSNHAPLSPVQLLWLNLIMDTLAALALATEQPTIALLDRKPLGKSAPLISRRMWCNIFGHSIYQLGLMLLLVHQGSWVFDVEHNSKVHHCMIFNTFIMLQIVNEFNARKLFNEVDVFDGIEHSKGHLIICAVMCLIQFLAVEFGGEFMNTVPLSFKQWMACTFFGLLSFPLGCALRSIGIIEPTYL